ncbi:MAG: hypothetical protein RIF42_02895, partial [Parvibaculaceae bacterium]
DGDFVACHCNRPNKDVIPAKAGIHVSHNGFASQMDPGFRRGDTECLIRDIAHPASAPLTTLSHRRR